MADSFDTLKLVVDWWMLKWAQLLAKSALIRWVVIPKHTHTHREREKHTHMHTGTLSDKRTERQATSQADRQADRHRH